MKMYLCRYIESRIENYVEDICKVIPENEANFKRGLVKMAKDILNMPQIIKNRMEIERSPRYKDFMKAIDEAGIN